MTRVPTGNPRGRPKGSAKTGGRVAGKSLDKGERLLITSQMAGDILSVYQRLGGADFLYRWAKENKTAYITSCLNKLMPAAPKDDADFVQNNVQINNLGTVEAARRVAYALAVGIYPDPSKDFAVYDDPSLAPIEAERLPPEPVFYPNQWTPPVDTPDMVESPLAEQDPAKALWVEEISLNPEQKRDRALVRQTQTATLENYAGGSCAEQGGHGQRQSSGTSRPTVNEIRRRQMRDRLL